MNTSQQNPHSMSLVIDGIQPSSNKGESHSELHLCQQNKALHDELNQLKHKIVQLETLNSDIEDENERFNKSNDFLKHYVKNLSNLSDQYKCLYEIYHSSHSDLSNVNNEFMKQQIMNSKIIYMMIACQLFLIMQYLPYYLDILFDSDKWTFGIKITSINVLVICFTLVSLRLLNGKLHLVKSHMGFQKRKYNNSELIRNKCIGAIEAIKKSENYLETVIENA